MSILERIRSGTDSGVMWFILAAIVVSFVAVGSGIGGGAPAQEVATVNGEVVTGVEFNRAYRLAEAQASQRSRGGLTDEDRATLREQVVQDLIRRKALLQEARRLGLEVSAAEIAEALFQYDFLLDEQGAFDRQAFENFLRRQGLTRANFEEQIREDLLVTKLQRLMILGASVSDNAVEQRWKDDNTKLDLQVAKLPPGALDAALNPTDAELGTWAETRQADLQARYDADFKRLHDQPEKVDVRVVRLDLRDDGLDEAALRGRLDAVRAEAEGGGDVAALAARWSEDPSAADGGLVAGLAVRDLDADVAAALGSLQPGQISPVLANGRDVRFYKLEARTAARVVPLDEVKLEIARALYREAEGPKRVAAFAEKELLPAWKERGAAPLDLLAPYALDVQSTGLLAPESYGFVRPPEAMVDAARTAEPGSVLPEVYEEGGVLWVGALVAREEPDLAKLEEEKPRIREGALIERRSAFLQAWVDEVVARATVQR